MTLSEKEIGKLEGVAVERIGFRNHGSS